MEDVVLVACALGLTFAALYAFERLAEPCSNATGAAISTPITRPVTSSALRTSGAQTAIRTMLANYSGGTPP